MDEYDRGNYQSRKVTEALCASAFTQLPFRIASQIKAQNRRFGPRIAVKHRTFAQQKPSF